MFAPKPRTAAVGRAGQGRRALAGLCAGVVAALLPLAAPAAGPRAGEPNAAVRVYGPGGPHEVLSECAALYRWLHGEEVAIYRSRPGALSKKLALEADLVYGGADYMLADFDRVNPGVLDMRTVEKLYPRRLGIVVRKGNPRGIRGLDDLRNPGLRVLQANFENVSSYGDRRAMAGGGEDHAADTGTEALRTWQSHPEIDAWITYRSWHAQLARETDFIEIQGEGALRVTPIVLTARTSRREAAARFVAFLKSPEAERIFRKHGWD